MTTDDRRPTTGGQTPSFENRSSVVGRRSFFSAWRRPLLLALSVVVAVRLLLSLWAAVVLAYFPTTDLESQYAHVGLPLQTGGLESPWQREDALWYEKIATVGYSPNDGTTPFLPLFPFLMRLASFITLGDVALAGILVSSLATVVALALFYRLATLDAGESTARRGVLYIALFPTAFFLYSGFTESLFLALAIGAFWHARHGRWPIVAGLAFLAGLTKVQGALLCLPLAAEYLASSNWGSRISDFGRKMSLPLFGNPQSPIRIPKSSLPTLLAVTLAGPLATAAFFAYIKYVIGDPLSWSERQNAMWQHRTTWPGETLAVAVQKLVEERALTINTFDFIVFVLFAILTVASFRLRLSYGLQATTVLIPSLLHVGAQFPLMSFSRYALSAFACFIVLAIWTDRRPRIIHLLIIALWVSLLLVWSSQFVRGYWVG